MNIYVFMNDYIWLLISLFIYMYSEYCTESQPIYHICMYIQMNNET
jgi:hypothetical protein